MAKIKNIKTKFVEKEVIHLSNLCVAPETKILTDGGYVTISEKENQTVNVWNGVEFSKVTVMKTGTNQELLTVKFSDGSEISATEYHKFYVKNNYSKTEVEKRTIDLTVGDKISKFDLPVIEYDNEVSEKYAYTHGFFCGDGCETNSNRITLYQEKKNLVEYLDIKSGSNIEDSSNRLNFIVNTHSKFEVPFEYSIKSKLNWLAGLFDSDGTAVKNNTNISVQVASINNAFLNDVKLMLQTMGIHSKVTQMRDVSTVQIRANEKEYITKPLYRLIINSSNVVKLLSMGLNCHRLNLVQPNPQRNATQYITVKSIEQTGRRDDTYCFNEPIRHRGMFNGILTGNCTEIIEVTSSGKKIEIPRQEWANLSKEEILDRSIRLIDFDIKSDNNVAIEGGEVAVCNLQSINIGRNYVKNGKLDKEKLRKNVATAVKFLDRVIDRNFYPIQEAESSNMRWRPVGLGLMGFADFLFQLRIPFESDLAKQYSSDISEEIYYQALKTSCELAKKHGAHKDFHLTKAAQGLLQFDLAGHVPSDKKRWDELKEEIKKYGLRNSLLIAIAPTATISHITGVEECVEPIKENILKRETLSGEFVSINKYLVEDLKKIGKWSPEMLNELIVKNGSIQDIAGLPDDFYPLYKTVWEMSQKHLIDHARVRGYWIDQSQSLNLFLNLNKFDKNRQIGVISSMYSYAHESGVKTTYYLRTKAASSINKVTTTAVSSATEAPASNLENPEICESCT